MADDIKAESTGLHREAAVIWSIVFLTICGVPLSWNKIQGGDEIRWIGYHILLSSFALGITESRAMWATDWLERVATDGCVRGDELRSAGGALSIHHGSTGVREAVLSSTVLLLIESG